VEEAVRGFELHRGERFRPATFQLHHHAADHPHLAIWHANVGEPVALDHAPPLPGPPAELDVVSWNVHIGRGRIDAVLERLHALHPRPDGATRPLVLLLQEAYRADPSLPPCANACHGGRPGRGPRQDVVTAARELGLSLRYAPSMRNGVEPSDRGNAVLSTAALGPAHAFALPYVRQRRVVVAAELAGVPGLTFASAHLDTHGVPRDHALPGPAAGTRAAARQHGSAGPLDRFRRRFAHLGPLGRGRAVQARALAERLAGQGTVVLGADLNSLFGDRDPAVRALAAAGWSAARRAGGRRHTLAGPLRLLLDHILFRNAGAYNVEVAVRRLEPPRGAAVPLAFGSDHHPLHARIRLTAIAWPASTLAPGRLAS